MRRIKKERDISKISLFFIWIFKKNVLSLYRKLKTKEQ